MRYLKDEPFRDRKGALVTLGSPNGQLQPVIQVGELVKMVLKGYVPSRECYLTMGEWRQCQKCLDILEAEPGEKGYFAFDDIDFVVMGRTVEGTVMTFLNPNIVQNGPQLVDLLRDAPFDICSVKETQ